MENTQCAEASGTAEKVRGLLAGHGFLLVDLELEEAPDCVFGFFHGQSARRRDFGHGKRTAEIIPSFLHDDGILISEHLPHIWVRQLAESGGTAVIGEDRLAALFLVREVDVSKRARCLNRAVGIGYAGEPPAIFELLGNIDVSSLPVGIPRGIPEPLESFVKRVIRPLRELVRGNPLRLRLIRLIQSVQSFKCNSKCARQVGEKGDVRESLAGFPNIKIPILFSV